MDDTYDVVVLGTGLTECILSGILSVDGMKVLHMDRNKYYGGACASLTLDQAWEHFKQTGQIDQKVLGRPNEYSIDLVPKFLMANGKLVKILLHTDVTRYLEFRSIAGSYVYKKGKLYKLPTTASEAMKSDLLGLLEKKRFADFLTFCSDFDPKEPKTFKGLDLKDETTTLLKKYKLDEVVKDCVGHAMALYRDDQWEKRPALETIDRVNLYADSLAHYGKSPYLYPSYGLGDLPQGFARLCAIYGGTYMLNKPIDSINYGSDGRVTGVTSEKETVKCKAVIGDPSYFMQKVEKVGETIRCVCILNHPIQGVADAESCQIIIPQNQVGRKNDIYISCVSHAHNVAPQGKYLVFLSTTVETGNPIKELDIALKMVEPVLCKFYETTPLLIPKNDHQKEHVYISNTYDATANFETICDDVLRIYTQITGKTDTSHLLVPKEKPKDEKQ